jgi:hypothetical protein
MVVEVWLTFSRAHDDITNELRSMQRTTLPQRSKEERETCSMEFELQIIMQSSQF